MRAAAYELPCDPPTGVMQRRGRYHPTCCAAQTSEWLGLRSRSKSGSLALFAAPHRGWQLRRTRLQSLLTVNKPTLIKDISGAGALHPMSAAPAVSMSVQG